MLRVERYGYVNFKISTSECTKIRRTLISPLGGLSPVTIFKSDWRCCHGLSDSLLAKRPVRQSCGKDNVPMW